MSQEEVRKRNAQLVVEKTLELGLQKGVNNVSIRDAARAAGLTERSVYRYFENREELILSTIYLFWDKLTKTIHQMIAQGGSAGLTGYQQVELVFRAYIKLFLEQPEYIRFIFSAEGELNSYGLTASIRARPPGRFDTSTSSMACALRLGQQDGSIGKDVDVKMFYYNAYDAILGIIQRQLLDSTECDLDNAQRLDHLCRLFLRSLREPI